MKGRYIPFGKLCSLLVLAGALTLAVGGPTTAEEGYDEDAYGPAAPIVWTKPVKAVVFSHKTHTKDAGLECDSCHDAIFEMAAGSAQEKADFTMESLYQGKYCGGCHDGSTAFASNTRCTACHIGVQGYNRMMGGKAGQGGSHGGGH